MDFGLLLLRMVVGALMFAHGMQKLTGAFGGDGPQGTAGFLASLGYRKPERMAMLAGLGEASAGSLLFIGFLTPFAGAALIGVMVNAIFSVHVPNGPWNMDGGYEYPVVLATVGASLAFAGPGEMSFDGALDMGLSGLLWGFTAIVIGVMGGAIVLWTREVEPVAAEETVEERRAA